MRNRKLSVAILTIVMLVVFLMPLTKNAWVTQETSPTPVHNINTGLNYTTIQAAINDPETLDGNTIMCDAGNYTENVNLYKSLKIIGAGPTLAWLIPAETNDTISVTASNVTIEGFRIQSVLFSGILLDDACNCTISSNVFTGNGGGITLRGSSENVISDNTMYSLPGNGVTVTDSSLTNEVARNILNRNHYGIVIFNASNYNVIEDNVVNSSDNDNIRLNWLGDGFAPVEFNTITDNFVSYGYSGIFLDNPSSNNVVLSNFASNNYIGIRLRQASNSTITHNTATSNTYGVYAEASDNNNISGNNITNNFDGIDLYSSSNNSISENNITNNSWNGVDLELSISNEIYHNNFINNTSQVSSDRSPNTWDNGYPSGGNYWSDYKGTDLYSGPYQNVIGSDGIGDTPYVIDANNTDYYPLMKLYVRILGDINGDDRVDMKDIGIAAKAFGSHCANYDYLGEAASPNWNPMCDLNGDGKIDLRDIALIARHFGQHYP